MSASSRIVSSPPCQDQHRLSSGCQSVRATAREETGERLSGVPNQTRLNHWKVKHLPLSTDRDRGIKRESKLQEEGYSSDSFASTRQKSEKLNSALYICPNCVSSAIPARRLTSSVGKKSLDKEKKISLENGKTLWHTSNYQVMTDSGISMDREVAFDLDDKKKRQLSWTKPSALTESFNDFRLCPDPPPSPATRPKERQVSLDSIYNSLSNEDWKVDGDEQLRLESRRFMLAQPISSGDGKRIGKIRLRIQNSIRELENMSKIPPAKFDDSRLGGPAQIDDIHLQLSILCEAKEVLNRQMQELWKMYLKLVFQEQISVSGSPSQT